MQRRTWGKLDVGPTSMALVRLASIGYFFTSICVIRDRLWGWPATLPRAEGG